MAKSKIGELFKRMNPFSSSQENSQKGKVFPNNLTRLYELMKVEEDRKKAYEECWVMYVQDSRIASAIDATAGSATNGGFTIQFNSAKTSEGTIKDAYDIINQVTSRTKLMTMISGIAKELLILGDVFMEVIVNSQENEIVNLKKLPARTIERVEDDFGNLTGYVQKDMLNQVIASFEPWQILHMRWNHFAGQMYGTSMLRPVRGVWKKLRMSEEDLVIRRRTRAGVKMHHYGSSAEHPLEPDEVDEYRTQNVSSPLNVRTDWYSNGKWKIDVLKSDDGVSAIDDIKHFEDLLLIGLRTPKGLLGLGEDANKATLERQEVAYIRLLNEISGEIGHQLKQVFDLGLQLKGISPDSVEYKAIWKERTVDDVNKTAERLVLLGNTGYISRKTATEEMGYNYEDERTKIESERAKMSTMDYALLVPDMLNSSPSTDKPNGSKGAPTISKQQIPNKNPTDKTGASDR